MFHQDKYQVTRHICTRNCYGACPILAYTRGGIIEKITADHSLPGSANHLCAKGKQILEQVYHPRRILHPLRQNERGSGRWQQISWDEAIDRIARKMLELKTRYGSTLPLALNKYSGNFGLLHYAPEGMFNSLGPTTQAVGTPCLSAGLDAQYLDFGGNKTAPLSQMLKSGLIILWGINPAWTAIHALPIIYAAKQQGTKVVVIDPVYTETAHKADYYIQIRPGSDASLAVLLLQIIAKRGQLHYDADQVTGHEELLAAIRQTDTQTLLDATQQSLPTMEFLADLIANYRPVHIWCGFGLQRHVNGGITIRLIDALSMLTGNIGIPGGGVNFADSGMQKFPHTLAGQRRDTRFISINNFAQGLKSLTDPPVKFLWAASRDLLRQDANVGELLTCWQNLELVVTADKFLTATAQMSDIFLPVTTEFESLDVFGDYFRHHLGINEPAIPPQGEAKSDLEIARLLTRRLNELAPGTSTFPADKSDEDFLTAEFPPAICQMLQINDWRDLYQKPCRYPFATIPWQDGHFAHTDGKFHCCKLPADIAELRPTAAYPFHLLTPHHQDFINGQHHTQLTQLPEYPVIYIQPQIAVKLGLTVNHPAIIWNELDSLTVTVKFRSDLSPDIIYSPQGTSRNGGLNRLNPGHSTDLGQTTTHARGLAIYDIFVNIRPVSQ